MSKRIRLIAGLVVLTVSSTVAFAYPLDNQWEPIGDSMFDLVSDGYNMVAFNADVNDGSETFFLQKGARLAMCVELHTKVGGFNKILGEMSCYKLVKPHDTAKK
jgi:hypothetical protein